MCPQAALVAIAENDPKRSKSAVELLKIPRSYSDYRELLEQPDIDAVTIALPNHLHAPVALASLQARKHVFLETPMATNAKAAAKIIEAARKARCMVMVGQSLRFHGHTQIAKEVLERGQIGEVYHVRCFYLRRAAIPPSGSWLTQKALAGGGCMYDLGAPILDACLHLLGDFDVRAVTAQMYSKLGPRGLGNGDRSANPRASHPPFDVEDYGTALIKLRAQRTGLGSQLGLTMPLRRVNTESTFRDGGRPPLYPARLFRDGAFGFESIDLALKISSPGKRDSPFRELCPARKKDARDA